MTDTNTAREMNLLRQVADKLTDICISELTRAERSIARLLCQYGYLELEDKHCHYYRPTSKGDQCPNNQ